MTTNNDQKKLFSLGAYKTATYTLTGMLNCHPEILILYETQLNKGEILKYARDFRDKYPDARYLFRFSENFDRLYSELGNYFRNKGYAYKYVGDKLPYLDINILRECEGNKIIYNFSHEEVRADINLLKSLSKFSPLPSTSTYKKNKQT